MKQEFTFIFKVRWLKQAQLCLFLFLALCLGLANLLYAEDGPGDPLQTLDSSKAVDRPQEIPESDNFQATPFTEYGEFNEADDEAESTLFFQYGRFFGISFGAGVEGALANRGILWSNGFPVVAFRFHYWFDFNFALQFGFYTVKHDYFFDENFTESVNVDLTHMGFALKYYIPTKDLSAAITFAGPFLVVGGGNYKKTETSSIVSTPDNNDVFSVNLGAGLEFPISYKSSYFFIEGLMHFPAFDDRFSTEFQTSRGLTDLKGALYTVTGNILFTW